MSISEDICKHLTFISETIVLDTKYIKVDIYPEPAVVSETDYSSIIDIGELILEVGTNRVYVGNLRIRSTFSFDGSITCYVTQHIMKISEIIKHILIVDTDHFKDVNMSEYGTEWPLYHPREVIKNDILTIEGKICDEVEKWTIEHEAAIDTIIGAVNIYGYVNAKMILHTLLGPNRSYYTYYCLLNASSETIYWTSQSHEGEILLDSLTEICQNSDLPEFSVLCNSLIDDDDEIKCTERHERMFLNLLRFNGKVNKLEFQYDYQKILQLFESLTDECLRNLERSITSCDCRDYRIHGTDMSPRVFFLSILFTFRGRMAVAANDEERHGLIREMLTKVTHQINFIYSILPASEYKPHTDWTKMNEHTKALRHFTIRLLSLFGVTTCIRNPPKHPKWTKAKPLYPGLFPSKFMDLGPLIDTPQDYGSFSRKVGEWVYSKISFLRCVDCAITTSTFIASVNQVAAELQGEMSTLQDKNKEDKSLVTDCASSGTPMDSVTYRALTKAISNRNKKIATLKLQRGAILFCNERFTSGVCVR